MRKTETITLRDGDTDLSFEITQMPATKLEGWILRTILLLAGSGLNVPDGADMEKAAEFVAQNGLRTLAGVDYEKAKPLLDDLLTCCKRRVDGALMDVNPATIDGYIDDVRTLFRLRMEVLKLNLGFFSIGGGLTFLNAPKVKP